MSASQKALRGLVGGALLVVGCAGLWDPFLAARNQDPNAQPDGGGGVISQERLPGLCPVANICWQNPLPQGNRLASVRAITSTDVWAVGTVGTILHWNGLAWSQVNSGTTAHLNDLWAYDASNLWVVGHGSTILRYTPPSFTPDAVGGLGDLYAIRGLDPQKIWAAGTNNAAIKWNGTQWAQAGAGTSITYRGIWPQDVNNAWACTVGGSIWAWHMQPDTIEQNGSNNDLLRMWGTSSSNLFAVGDSGQILRREVASSWRSIASGTSASLRGMWGPDANDAWIVGSANTILHWDGVKSVLSSDSGAFGGNLKVELNDVSGVSKTDIWAVGEAGALAHRDASGWTLWRAGPTATIYSGWAASENDAWAVGAGGLLLHWDGAAWRETQAPVSTDWYAVAGTSASNVWVVGAQGNAMRWDGSKWSLQPVQTSADLRGLYVAPGGAAVIAVGSQGSVYRYIGNWQKQTTNITTHLNAIWGSGTDDIWAAGQGGVVIHWNGTAWSPVYSPSMQEIYAISGVSVSNLWFVGANATALFWDGVMLRSRNLGLTGTLRAVSSSGTGTLAAGESGVFYRFVSGMPGQWSPQSSGTGNTLRAIVQRPVPMSTELWLLGDSGSILLYKG